MGGSLVLIFGVELPDIHELDKMASPRRKRIVLNLQGFDELTT